MIPPKTRQHAFQRPGAAPVPNSRMDLTVTVAVQCVLSVPSAIANDKWMRWPRRLQRMPRA